MALAKALNRVGYSITRQTGSHMRLTLAVTPQHHVTVPAHQPLKVGTLAAISTKLRPGWNWIGPNC